MKNYLYLISGQENISKFENFHEECQDIDLEKVLKVEFSTEEDKIKAVNLMYITNSEYICIDEDEYNLLIN